MFFDQLFSNVQTDCVNREDTSIKLDEECNFKNLYLFYFDKKKYKFRIFLFCR